MKYKLLNKAPGNYFGLLLAICIFCLGSCKNKIGNSGAPVVVIDSGKVDFEIKLKDWQIIGPFPDDKSRPSWNDKSDTPGLDFDYLKDFGLSEEKVNSSDLDVFKKDKSIHKETLTDEFINKHIHSRSKNIYFSKYFKKTDKSTVYAFCEIYSSKEQDVVIITGSDDGIKVWLNNKVIINKPLPRSLRDYQDVGRVHLKKGENLLIAKVYNIGLEWGLCASICSYPKAREISVANSLLKLFEKGIYSMGDSLKINISLYPSKSDDTRLTISDCFENEVLSNEFKGKETLNLGLSQLTEGVYSARINTGLNTYNQWFYYGIDVDSLLPDFIERCKEFNQDQAKINLNTLLIRYKHLVDPENKKPDDPVWQGKILFVIKELEIILYELKHGTPAFSNKIGLHLRGYRSKIDDQEQYYRVYVPSQYKDGKNPFPVSILVPFITDPIRPFLKSTHIANISREEELTKASEKYGQIIVWPNTRGYTFGTPIENADFFEVMEAVMKDYNIDVDRVNLMGICSGGLAALTLGMRYPSKFAAIGNFSPNTIQSVLAKSQFDISYEDGKQWLVQNNPIQFVSNFSNIPMYIIHGAKNHAPLKQSLTFIEKCKRTGISPYFKVYYGQVSPLIDDIDYTAFDFFGGKILEKSPETIDFSTSQLKYNNAYWVTVEKLINFSEKARIVADHHKPNFITVKTENIARFEIQLSDMGIDRTKPLVISTNGKINFNDMLKSDSISIDVLPDNSNGNSLFKNHDTEGPIMHAFSKGFILADCESPGFEKKELMSSPCDSFLSAWKRDFFVEGSRYKKASEINQEDIARFNLVLFGNPDNNVLIKRIVNQLPLKFTPEGIKLGNKFYKGKNLGINMIYPNPLSKTNYVVIVGSNNWENFTMPATNLALEGWYDYIIWDTFPTGFRHILDFGYFDNDWQFNSDTNKNVQKL